VERFKGITASLTGTYFFVEDPFLTLFNKKDWKLFLIK
jgi:hypothetical protein